MDTNNKNNSHNQNNFKKESQIIKEIQSILQNEYGYSPNQIKLNASIKDSERKADLVVFDENESPIIIVEISKDKFVLPLSEFQLKEILFDWKVNFGLLYNRIEKRAYQIIGNNLVEINDIPKKKLFEEKSTINIKNDEFRQFELTEKQIWRIVETVRRDFYEYEPFLQILSLKILDEYQYKGKLFEKYYTKHFDKEDIIKLIEVGKQTFPILFSSTKHILDKYTTTKYIDLFEIIKNFSIQKSNMDTITKVILKLSSFQESVDFPEELSYFMLGLLSIAKNEKILATNGRWGYTYHISKFLENKFNLTNLNLSEYLQSYLFITEENKKQVEILQLISLLRKEPVNLISERFLELDQNFIDEFKFILSIPPIGAEIDYKYKDENKFENYGKQLINYVFAKLLKSHKSQSKIAIIVQPNFLFLQSSNRIRLSILKHGFLRGIFQLPHGIFMPLTGIPLALIFIDFHKPNNENLDKEHIFLSQIPESAHPGQKLDSKILAKVFENFKKFEKGQEFEQTSLSFILPANKLTDTWTVSDKTPEMQKILKIPYGTNLGNLAKIFYGKPGFIEVESEQNHIKIPYLRISDLQNGLINSPVQRSVTIKNDQKYSEIFIRENDILLSCQGTIGKVALARKSDTGILPSPQIVVIRPDNNKILPEYLIQALNAELVQYQLARKSQGTFIKRINREDLEDIIVPNPPISKQKKLITHFQKEKNKIENLERALIEAKENLLKFNFGDEHE